jgi:hypothetical protein
METPGANLQSSGRQHLSRSHHSAGGAERNPTGLHRDHHGPHAVLCAGKHAHGYIYWPLLRISGGADWTASRLFHAGGRRARSGARRSEGWGTIDRLPCPNAGSYIVPVVYLAERLAHPVDFVTETLHAPAALSGIVIALLVAAPEAIGAVRAALANKLQRSVNWISALLDRLDCPLHGRRQSLDRSPAYSRR